MGTELYWRIVSVVTGMVGPPALVLERGMARTFVLLSTLALGSLCYAQSEKLTLADALKAARENNGVVQAARLNYESAKASTRAAYAAFLPTVTPSLQQENGKLNVLTGAGRGESTIDTTDSSVVARWLLFDNGVRGTNYRKSELAREQTEFNSLDTYRAVLFDVHFTYYGALRSQELLKVAESSLERATRLQDAAEKRESVGAGPRKDILQAKADALNAKVNLLTATNQVSTNLASLKAVLGWPTDTVPELDASQDARPTMVDYTLEQAIADGLANRPSLLAARKRVESSKLDVTLAKLDGGVSFQATANFTKSFSESVYDRPSLAFTASIPLYDGSRSRENIKAAQLGYEADRANLVQTERDVRAEIESAYKEFQQDFDRLEAAKLAKDAAQLNYDAAEGAYKEGAGTILDQLTAQVSLATAESNYVQAYYDLLISEVKLKQVVGKPLPGETAGE